MRRHSIALSVLAALMAGQASVEAAPKAQLNHQCFSVRDIDNSVQASETSLNIKTRDHRYFQVLTKGICFSRPLGLDPYLLKVRGSDEICQPIDMDLSGGPRGFVMPCIVDKIVPMTKAQVDALPPRERP